MSNEPMPASSKTGPLLAKVEPISDGGNTSVIMYLKRGNKKTCTRAARERSEKM